MQRPDSAGWRFYCAFYQWSALPVPRRSASRCHTALQAHVRASSSPHKLGRLHAQWHLARSPAFQQARCQSTAAAGVAERADAGQGRHEIPAALQINKGRGTLASRPIQTPAELPSDRLALFDFAIRARSKTDVTLQIKTPEYAVAALRRRFGDTFQRLAENFGVRLSATVLGASLANAAASGASSKANYALTVSGSLDGVASVRREINCFKASAPASETHQPDAEAIRVGFTTPERARAFIIGFRGKVLKQLRNAIKCHVTLVNEQGSFDVDPDRVRTLDLVGSPEAIERAKATIQRQVNTACELDGVDMFECKEMYRTVPSTPHSPGEAAAVSPTADELVLVVLGVPQRAAALVIGKSGKNLTEMYQKYKCSIWRTRSLEEASDNPDYQCQFSLKGSDAAVTAAKQRIQKIVDSKSYHSGVPSAICEEISRTTLPANELAAETRGSDTGEVFQATVEIPFRAVGLILGPQGRTIAQTEELGCKISVWAEDGSAGHDPSVAVPVTLLGTNEAIRRTRQRLQHYVDHQCTIDQVESVEVREVLRESATTTGVDKPGAAVFLSLVEVPRQASRPITGKNGSTLKILREATGCSILRMLSRPQPEDFRTYKLVGSEAALNLMMRRLQRISNDALRRMGMEPVQVRETARHLVRHSVEGSGAVTMERLDLGGLSLMNIDLVGSAKSTSTPALEPGAAGSAIPNSTLPTPPTYATTPGSVQSHRSAAGVSKQPEAAAHDLGMSVSQATSSANDRTDANHLSRPLSPELMDRLRIVFRSMTHPVVLITTFMLHASFEPFTSESTNIRKGCRGMTVSSFNTVSLTPRPLVSFNVKVPSRTWSAINAYGYFQAHILASNARGVAIADAFTKRHEQPHLPFEMLKAKGVNILFEPKQPLAPLLADRGVLKALRCRVLAQSCVQVADHIIVVAEVEGTSPAKEEQEPGIVDTEVGLSYAQQAYRAGGEVIRVLDLADTITTETKTVVEEETGNDDDEMQNVLGAGPTDMATKLEAVPGDSSIRSEGGEQFTSERFHEEYFQAATEAPSEAPEDEAVVAVSKLTLTEDLDSVAGHEQRPASIPSQEESLGVRDKSEAGNHTSQPSDDMNGLSTRPPLSPSRPLANKTGPWGVSAGIRAFSTDPIVSTSPSSLRFSNAARVPKQQHTYLDASKMDPQLLQMTVSDFLNIAEFTNIPRSRAIRDSRFRAEKAARRLQRARNSGQASDEEVEHLQSTIDSNQQTFHKRLALYSAKQLRRMLDSGRIDGVEAHRLEEVIERGQVVVLGEARRLRELVDTGEIDHEQAIALREILKREHDALTEQTRRLRGLMEDGGLDSGQSPETPSSFDGFRGNV